MHFDHRHELVDAGRREIDQVVDHAAVVHGQPGVQPASSPPLPVSRANNPSIASASRPRSCCERALRVQLAHREVGRAAADRTGIVGHGSAEDIAE